MPFENPCLPACFRIAVRGGPSIETDRGITLGIRTGHLDHIIRGFTDMDALIEAQAELVHRAHRLYNQAYCQKEEELLAGLVSLKERAAQASLDRKALALEVFALLVNYEGHQLA